MALSILKRPMETAENLCIGWLLFIALGCLGLVVIIAGVRSWLYPDEHRNCGEPDE